jgi:hypothetical protein
MTIKTTDLVELGAIAAEAYDECDTALKALNESFGAPYEAAKDNLLCDVTAAENAGLDLSVFSGDKSRFRFPEHNTNIVVRISRVPTSHDKLEKLSAKVNKLEQELKVAKMQLKHAAEALVLTGECDQTTEKIVLAFTRLKK